MSTLDDRFWDKVHHEPNSGCWLWVGAQTSAGYGEFWFDGKTQYAHRVAYQVFKEAIPHNLQVDHKCCIRCCVNPDHLEAVSSAENSRRAENCISTMNSKKTHCPQGHPYDEQNTYVCKLGRRSCRACKKLAMKRYYIRQQNKKRCA